VAKSENLKATCNYSLPSNLGVSSLILQLKRHHVDLLKQEARKVHPIEACAMLFGKLSKNEAFVEKVVIAPNELWSTVSFEIDPMRVVSAFNEADEEGLVFIGLFHSHPAPAAPSSIDLKFMKLWGDALWLILSSTDGNLAAYQIKDGRVEEAIIGIE
jgi:proteasome lid subunit RPN8/RPN11